MSADVLMPANDVAQKVNQHLGVIIEHVAPSAKNTAKAKLKGYFSSGFLQSEQGVLALGALAELAVKIRRSKGISRDKIASMISELVQVAAHAERNSADSAAAVEALATHLPTRHKHSGTLFALAQTGIMAKEPLPEIFRAGLKALSKGRQPGIVQLTASTAYSRQQSVEQALLKLALKTHAKLKIRR